MSGIMAAFVGIGRRALSAVAAPTDVSGVGDSGGIRVVTSNATTATPAGGSGAVTYAWTYVSGTALTVTSVNANSTTFSKSLTIGQSVSAIYKCVVTDTNTGEVVDTNNVTVSLDN